METELFMECEEEELEPWQQVDDSVEEEEMDFVDYYGEPDTNSDSTLTTSGLRSMNILKSAMTNVERFRFEDARGRTFESRGEMVMCGGCGGKFFRIVSHLKKSRTCSSHLDLDKFEKLLILYNRKRKRKPEAKASEETSGFSVVTAFAH
ncbi:hypothetical protein F2P81_025365 [Scophthalmus maximus]|uniref:Uncharacterized protein n=1 Tax=Scophthalmus maximus TaxID=52904 RepID=A0A6A4RQP6_SCOMX|nr:hypothetical protein F2P81_025365 [Scophthalmus maximus]